ncbi:MAG: Ig-like domain-containing protein [Archangium sp.]|nr:Ig-like domain-containing protein [Archangium sp.]MDP3569509.1 Ig-like domain-containing protein [Archangium sp.]
MIHRAVVVCLFLLSCSPDQTQPQAVEVAHQKSALVANFASGTLIIPMDTTSQNNGTLRAFGLVDRLLRANVSVHRVALTGKLQTATDFSATVSQRETNAALGTVSYRAGPFIVASTDVTPAALTLVDTYLASDAVTNVHVATAAFSADVQRTLVAAPRIAVLRDGNESIAYGYLNAANIQDSNGNTWSDTSPGSLSLTAAAGATGGAFDGALFSGGQPAFDQLTSMHYTPPAVPEVVREVRGWLSLGPTTHAYMQCDAIAAFENDVNGRFLTTLGVVDDGAAITPIRVVSGDSLFNQFDGTLTADNGSVDSIGLAPLSTLRVNSSLLIDRAGSPSTTRMLWLTGHIDGDTTKGKISYLGGHNYTTTLPISTNPQTNGTRLFLNGLYETPGLFGSDQPVLTVTKTAPATTSATNFTFTINYTNAGPGAVFAASLVDVLPTGTTFVSATGGGVHAAGTVTWTLGTLAKNATGSVTVTVTSAEGTYANQATLNYRVGLTRKSTVSNTTSTIVDRTAPNTTLTSTPPAASSSTSANFAFTSTEAGTFECSLDGAAFTVCTTPFAVAGLSNGSHTFEVRARDAALNVDATPASFTWTVDTIAPDTTLTATPPALSSTATANFSFTSTEAGTFECSLDGAAFVACTSPAALSGLADGSHTFRARAIDAAGNTDATPASFTWTIDTTAPDTTLTSTPPAVSNSSSANFAFTSTEAGTFECSLDGAAFAACTSPRALSGLTDGAHTFRVRARDAAGNLDATPASFTWTVDATAPDTTLTSTPPTQSNSTSATFTFTSNEAGTFECSLDGAVFALCTSPAAFAALSEGSHTFAVRARDTAGNTDATPARFSWSIDTAAPETTITGGPAASTNSTSASITFTSSEAGTFECSLDGAAFTTCSSPFTATGLAEGSHTVLVRAIDASGNVDATPASRTWVVDLTAPTTTITTAPPALSSSTAATFEFTSGEFGATFQCSLDGAPFTTCVSPLTLTGLGQGSHTFLVQAVDAAGNVDATPASHTWSVDTIEPDTTLVSGPSGSVSSTSATFVVTSEATATFECSLDGAAFTACNAMSSYSGLSEGSHTVAIRAVDTTGNVDSTPVSRTWTVDTVLPDTTIASGPSGVVSSSTAAFTFTSTESPVTFECALDGAAFTACSASTSLTGLGEGSHTLRVRAVDAALNADASPASQVWTVDTLAPDTTITGAPSGTTNVSTASITFSSNEAGVTFECSLDGAAFAACTSPVSLSALTDGAHTFSARAIDAAGNVDPTPATASWTIDAAVPDTSLTAGPSGAVSSADAQFTFTSTKANSTFECSLDGAAFAACTTPSSFTGLSDGSHTFSVRAIDPVGNVDPTPATRTWSIDTQAPDTTITVSPDALTNTTSGRFEFTSPESGATFECSLDGAAWAVCTSPLVTTGTLADGVHVMLVRSVDAAGNVDATPASATWQVDTVAPAAPAITEPVADATTGALPRFGGLAEAGSTVTVTINGMAVCTATASANGQWACSATVALTSGANTATATATDGAGNTSVPSLPRAFTVGASPPDTVILTGPAALTRVAQADFTLSSDVNGATFECSLDGAAFMPCTAAVSFTVSDGAHVLAVRAVSNGATDASPATRAWTLDSTAPAAPVLTSPTASSTTSTTPTFSGTAEPGSTVVVSIDGQPVCTAVSDAAGTFSCAGATALPPGAHSATAVATDPAGNVSPPSPGVPFTVGGVTLDTAIIAGPSGTVSSTSAGFAFTSTLVGATFECSLDGAAFVACSTPVTFSGLASGSHTLEVRAVDGANVDTTPATRTWIIDATAPIAPTVTTPIDQATIRTRTPRYSGTAEPGSTVIVSVDDRQVCTTIADANGAWSCTSTLPLSDGAHRVAATAVDGAGNRSAQSTVNRFVVDIPAMTVAITSPVSGALTNDATPGLSGTATPGSTVSVFVDGVLLGTALADSSGAWSFTPSAPIADGVHVITARAELEGLVSATSDAVNITIDTRAPVVTLTVTQENTETVPDVTFTADESPVTYTCSIDGAAFTACSSPLDVSLVGDGNHTVVVRATDAAGNTGEATKTYVVTAPIVTRPAIAVRGGGCGCASTDGLSGVLSAFALLFFAARGARRRSRRLERVSVQVQGGEAVRPSP